ERPATLLGTLRNRATSGCAARSEFWDALGEYFSARLVGAPQHSPLVRALAGLGEQRLGRSADVWCPRAKHRRAADRHAHEYGFAERREPVQRQRASARRGCAQSRSATKIVVPRAADPRAA